MAGLALLAASYHLTESAHRQTDRARLQTQSARQASAVPRNPLDKPKGTPKPQRPVLSWLAPDMVNRNALRVVALEEVARRVAGDAPAWASGPWPLLIQDQVVAPTLSSAPHVARSTCQIPLSDRPAHGPPAAGGA